MAEESRTTAGNYIFNVVDEDKDVKKANEVPKLPIENNPNKRRVWPRR